MPTEPSARDREEARRIAGRCWYATGDSPDATCDAVGAPDRCVQCVETDAIATALAAREAEGREAMMVALRAVQNEARGWNQRRGTLNDACLRFNRIDEITAAAIRAQGGGA